MWFFKRFTLALIMVTMTISVAIAQAVQPDQKPPQDVTITDNYGNRIGKISPDTGDKSKLTDNYGNLKGYINKDGVATDKYGNRTGYIKK